MSLKGSRLNSWQGQLRTMQRWHAGNRKKEQKLTWGAGRPGTMPSPAWLSSRRKVLQEQSDPPQGKDLQIQTLGTLVLAEVCGEAMKLPGRGCVSGQWSPQLISSILPHWSTIWHFPQATCRQPRTAKHLRKISNKITNRHKEPKHRYKKNNHNFNILREVPKYDIHETEVLLC